MLFMSSGAKLGIFKSGHNGMLKIQRACDLSQALVNKKTVSWVIDIQRFA